MCVVVLFLRFVFIGARQMSHRLGALAALSEDPGSVPSPPRGQFPALTR